MNAVLRVARSGDRCSDLPACFGKYAAVKRRYYRFIEPGFFDAMFAAISDDAGLEWLRLDAPAVGEASAVRGQKTFMNAVLWVARSGGH